MTNQNMTNQNYSQKFSNSDNNNSCSRSERVDENISCIFATLKDKFDTAPHLSSDGKTSNAAQNLTNLLCAEILSDENKIPPTPNSMKKKRVPKELTLASLINDKPNSTSVPKIPLETQKNVKACENYSACINLQKACPFLENSKPFNNYKAKLQLRLPNPQFAGNDSKLLYTPMPLGWPNVKTSTKIIVFLPFVLQLAMLIFMFLRPDRHSFLMSDRHSHSFFNDMMFELLPIAIITITLIIALILRYKLSEIYGNPKTASDTQKSKTDSSR